LPAVKHLQVIKDMLDADKSHDNTNPTTFDEQLEDYIERRLPSGTETPKLVCQLSQKIIDRAESLEVCPACESGIPLLSITKGICEKRHAWNRCMFTFQILKTPSMRTCANCRGTSLKLEELEEIAGKLGWHLKDFYTCRFCGSYL
jgi:hypothetical protein